MKYKARTIKILIVMILFSMTFIYNYNGLCNDFRNTAASRKADIDTDIQMSVNFIDMLTIYGNNYFGDEKAMSEELSELYSMLKYQADTDSYHLDAAKDTASINKHGNITGKGAIPATGASLQNIGLAFSYYDFWYKFYDRFPDIAWIYYTGEHDFISMYPWVSSKKFSYREALKKVPFYSVAIPENNLSREAVWTPVYLDEAGKGLMVTLSSPIYDEDTFMGVVSIDITNSRFSELLQCPYESYLIDAASSVIATTQEVPANDRIISFGELIQGTKIDPGEIMAANNDTVQIVGNSYVYTSTFDNTPWRMIMTESIYTVILRSLIGTIPVILICILLLFTMYEVEKRRKAETVLIETANTDQLTGSKSRRYLEEKISEEICRADRYHKPTSLIIFDLDHFKSINDQWGHPVGDGVLIHVANLTKDTVRDVDTVARLGGEEFAVLLPETSLKGAKVLADRICTMLNENIHAVAGPVTASFGVAERHENETFDSWYKRADHAVYLAKEKGRNCVVCDE